MRRPVACLGLLLCAGALLAAGRALDGGGGKPSPSPELHADAQNYATQLVYVAAQVSERYVRPVSRAELLAAALHGLYEAARTPAPPGLAADLEKAASEQEYVALLARAREGLGDAEPVRGPNALLASCRAMTKVLDPHSGILTGEELRRAGGVDDQQGVGLEFADNVGVGPLLVKTVFPGGPAQAAGVRPGDEVTEIDGKPVKDLGSGPALLLCNRGAPAVEEVRPGGSVELTLVRRSSRTPRKVTLERQEWQPETLLGVARQADNSWDYLADKERKLAHVRVAALGNATALRVREVVTALQAAGMRGLLLDLRWCPGGYLREAVHVAALFLGECNVATVRGRHEADTHYPSTPENKFLDFPIVVLVNGETSGGAELIAAALQDHHRAVVAGQRTLGKASIQTMVPLGVPDAGLKLTSGTFVRPGGKNLHRFPDSKPGDDWGVRPDPKAECRVSPELNRQLREWWLQQTLRPGGSTEVLPLDDPGADPQRQEALDVLLGMVGK